MANNLSDNLGIVRDLLGSRRLARVDLREAENEGVYPYGVVALPPPTGSPRTVKVHGSCWGTGMIAVVEPGPPERLRSKMPVGRHPTGMLLNAGGSRLYVVNSNADSVSVIDTEADREIERTAVGLAEDATLGSSPAGLALVGTAKRST